MSCLWHTGENLSCLCRTRLIQLSCRLATNRPPELPLGIPRGRFPVLNKNRFSLVPQTLMFTSFSFPQGSPRMPKRNGRKHCKCNNHSLTFSQFTPHIHVVSCTSLLTPPQGREKGHASQTREDKQTPATNVLCVCIMRPPTSGVLAQHCRPRRR